MSGAICELGDRGLWILGDEAAGACGACDVGVWAESVACAPAAIAAKLKNKIVPAHNIVRRMAFSS
jgi:hypothetical protein